MQNNVQAKQSNTIRRPQQYKPNTINKASKHANPELQPHTIQTQTNSKSQIHNKHLVTQTQPKATHLNNKLINDINTTNNQNNVK